MSYAAAEARGSANSPVQGEAGNSQEAAAVEAALKEAFVSADDEIVGLAVDK